MQRTRTFGQRLQERQRGKRKGKDPQKKNLKAIHALFKGLTKAEQMELLALSEKKDEETEGEEKTEDF